MSNESLVREGKASLDRGVAYLLGKQAEDGSWGSHPAITALVCTALKNSLPCSKNDKVMPAVEKGRNYILKFVQPDGSIWMAGKEREFPSYSTSIILTGLAIFGHPEDEDVMRGARKYLIGSQIDESKGVQKDNAAYGGIGYDSKGLGRDGKPHADLSNTQWAMEALYMSDFLDKEPKAKNTDDAKKSELAWGKAVAFVSRLQHLPESNDRTWVVSDKNDSNYGGFIYRQPESQDNENAGAKQSLRSYGSMTYAGLKTMIYAKLSKDDPRIKAAIEWARKNYTLDENPGVGPSGLYYYITTFAKAHSVLGDEIVKTDDGKEHSWRMDMIKKLLELQKGNGEWFNENGRWMESMPELVSAYALLSMEAALLPSLAKQ
ncbi:MAG: hypothetical protein A2X49_11155 [Lentisphaerae bacterium GWF2_52_8]|nr:MAG: hypothetical protein A2X49_11155 [Lentisphaerae bacterium GWF2_52_8]